MYRIYYIISRFYTNFLFYFRLNMKDWHFWVIVAIILIQSFYLSMKMDSIEKQEAELAEYAKNIDQNVVKIDERIVWELQPKTDYLYNNN